MNEQLNTFIEVAETGSFSKAAEKLFISPTAVMKQMNLLEKQVEVPLFIRTNHGVKLTDAGKSFSKDAVYMMQYFQDSLLRMRQATQTDQAMIRVGTSMNNPCKVLLELWNEVSNQYPQFKINIIHFEDDTHSLPTTYRSIGKDFDFMVGPFLADIWNNYFHMLELGRYRFCFAVSSNHRLASKETLSVKDLYGEKLAVVNGGKSKVIAGISDFFKENHPLIHIKDVPRLFDIEVFNRCEETGTVLLTLEAWTDIHPSLVTIPSSDLDFTIPYGLLYPINPTENVNQFLDIIKDVHSKHKSKNYNSTECI